MKKYIRSSVDPRPIYSKMMEMLDAGVIRPENLADELMQWLSEDELAEFCRVYEYIDEEDYE